MTAGLTAGCWVVMTAVQLVVLMVVLMAAEKVDL
jgi:hypothetical protein